MRPQTVPIPQSLSHLKRDRRGLPIFYTVTIMRDGTPDFRVVDLAKAQDAAARKVCGLSGHRLDKRKGAVFVGGPRSAFSPDGMYIDPPMLESAAFYALKVCPYLSAPKYGSGVFAEKGGGHVWGIAHDETVVKDRPEVFVAVKSRRWQVINHGGGVRFHPQGPHMEVSFWTHGGMVGHPEASALSPHVPTLEAIEASGTVVRQPENS